MKRLREQQGELSAADADVLDLLEAHDDMPLSDLDKRRILNQVRASGSRSVSQHRVGLAAVAALLASGTLLASWGAGWLGEAADANGTVAPATPADSSAVADETVMRSSATFNKSSAGEGSGGNEDSDSTVDEDAVGKSAAEEQATRENRDNDRQLTATPRRATLNRNEAESPGEDPTLVAEALRALRKHGEPERAEKLLRRYRASNPNGALSEDALALSIEAAAARNPQRAAQLAREYLAKYPNGRYRSTAERALRLKTHK